jgi:tetratricopeptide (TPR) repeat protein
MNSLGDHTSIGRDWTDEQIVETLVSVCGNGETPSITAYQGRMTLSLVRALKEKVVDLSRVNICQATTLAEVTCAAARWVANPESDALAHHVTALVLAETGQYAAALAEYDRAEAIYWGLGREVDAGRIGRARVGVMAYMGEYERALQIAAEVSALFERHGQDVLWAQTQDNVGSIYYRLDCYREALKFF